MSQQIKDTALSLLWIWLLLWLGSHPWPRNLYMPWAEQKEKKKKKVYIYIYIHIYIYIVCKYLGCLWMLLNHPYTHSLWHSGYSKIKYLLNSTKFLLGPLGKVFKPSFSRSTQLSFLEYKKIQIKLGVPIMVQQKQI